MRKRLSGSLDATPEAGAEARWGDILPLLHAYPRKTRTGFIISGAHHAPAIAGVTASKIVLPGGKGNLAVLATRKFGITCPVCKRFCSLGYIEIEEKASVGELRAKLLHEGWKGEWARCDDMKCEGQIFCPWNLAVFPR